jgi:hypothetical protein
MRVIVPPSGDRYHDIEASSKNIETECGLSIQAEAALFLGSERQAKHNGFEKCDRCSSLDGTPSV